MINVLGSPGYSGNAKYTGLDTLLETKGAYFHNYGKMQTRPNRKMGHVTIMNEDLSTAIKYSEIIQNTLKVIA